MSVGSPWPAWRNRGFVRCPGGRGCFFQPVGVLILLFLPRDALVINDVYANDADALRTAAEEKHARYDDLAERLKMRLFAVPVSAFGRLHDETVAFIHHLAKEVNQYRRADFVRDMKVAIQHAILLRNAQTVDACHARINDKAGNWLQ